MSQAPIKAVEGGLKVKDRYGEGYGFYNDVAGVLEAVWPNPFLSRCRIEAYTGIAQAKRHSHRRSLTHLRPRPRPRNA